MLVTERLLSLVKAESMVSVMDFPEVDPGPGEVVRDIPEPTYVDHAARAVDEAKRLDAEAAALQAQLDLAAKRDRVAKLRSEVAKVPAAEPVHAENKSKK